MSTISTPDDQHPENRDGRVEQEGRLRDQAGRQRDTAAGRRDGRGARRDEAADERDREARRPYLDRGAAAANAGPSADTDDSPLPAADSGRAHAHVDRVAAANDRADAATDRQEALADRMAAARDRRHAGLDSLTGVYNRDAGLLELKREISRAARTHQLLIVAFIDVDQLKAINDSQGHAAGDHALIAVADTLLTALRPYDLVIRYGGDEFLCAAEGIDVPAATLRFTHVNDLLAKAVPGLSVTAGLAQLRPGETLEAVTGRADADLYQQRQQRSRPGGR